MVPLINTGDEPEILPSVITSCVTSIAPGFKCTIHEAISCLAEQGIGYLDLYTFQSVDAEWLRQFCEGLDGGGLSTLSHYVAAMNAREVADEFSRWADEAELVSKANLPNGCWCRAFATNLPGISSPIRETRCVTVEALKKILELAHILKARAVEIVGGPSVLRPRVPPHTGVFAGGEIARLRQECLVESLVEIESFLEEREYQITVALELEPGTSYLLNSLGRISEVFARLRERIDFQHISFNFDMGHILICMNEPLLSSDLHLALISAERFSEQIREERCKLPLVWPIGHSHISFHRSTHAADLPLKRNYQPLFQPLVDLVIDSYIQEPRYRFASWTISVELEACLNMPVVHHSYMLLKEWIDNSLKRYESPRVVPREEPLRILHLSDLHIRENSDVKSILRPLIEDLQDQEDGLGLNCLDYLVFSGDLSYSGQKAEFDKALEFISELVQTFHLREDRCIVVPGNHDVNWNEPVERYPFRFHNFSENLYLPLINRGYPLDFNEQCIPFLSEDDGIQFLAINSCWRIDEHRRKESDVIHESLMQGLDKADEQIEEAGLDTTHVLRIAVWHHPLRGDASIKNDIFLGHLQKARFKLCLHGHVHKEQADVVHYLHPDREMYIAGAGALDAPAEDLPESTPRLYSLLEVDRDHSKIRVNVRCQRREHDVWTGWPKWRRPYRGWWRDYYEVEI